MFFPTFDEAEVDEGFEDDLAFSFVDPDREFSYSSLIRNDLDDFCLVFELFAQVLDFSCHREARCDFGLHGIEDGKIFVCGLFDSDSFGAMCEVSYLYGDFVELVDFDVLENNFGRDDLKMCTLLRGVSRSTPNRLAAKL